MGNADSHDFLPVWDPEQKVLDLKHVITHDDYTKHVRSRCDDCLDTVPSHVLEEISLYEEADFSFNRLPDVPCALPVHLPHLRRLDLSHNQLTDLPNSICLFFHLRVLLVHHNRLNRLPDSIVNLHALEKLDVSHNALRRLPSDFHLRRLRKLDVSHNMLEALPRSLAKCDRLTVVLAVANQCVVPPQCICDAGSKAIVGYIRKHFKEAKERKSDGNVFERKRANLLKSAVDAESMKARYAKAETDTSDVADRTKTPLAYPPDATTYSPEEMKDRILGLIYGAVIGDALGLLTERMTADESRFHYEEDQLSFADIIIDEHRLRWKRGRWTSTADVMMIVMDSIIHWAGVADELDYARRLSEWKKHGLLDDDVPAYITSEIIDAVVSTDDFVTSPHAKAAALLTRSHNGHLENEADVKKILPETTIDGACLPPSIVLGITHFHNLSEVISNAVRICSATHADPQCIAASVAVACIVALLLQGKYNSRKPNDVEHMYGIARTIAVEKLSDIEHIKHFNKCFSDLNFDSVLQNDTEDDHPFATLRVAASVLRMYGKFEEILPKIVMQGGCSTTRCCIAGAFLGFDCGYKRLPNLWLKGLDKTQTEWLDAKLNLLLDTMSIP